MLREEEIDQLEKGTLHIDCVRIELTGHLNGESRSHIGPCALKHSVMAQYHPRAVHLNESQIPRKRPTL